MDENRLGEVLIGAAIAVHKELGPGLLESVYEVALAHELRARRVPVDRQVPVAVHYRGMQFDEGFRIDLRVGGKVLVELKCVDHLHNAHRKQLLTYLKLTGAKLGYLLNFSECQMRDGVVRIVNGLGA